MWYTHDVRYTRYSPTGRRRRVFCRRRCHRSPGNLRRYTRTVRDRVTHLFFPSRRCRYCCVPPPPPSPPPDRHHRRYLSDHRDAHHTCNDRRPVSARRRTAVRHVAKRLAPLRVFCFVVFLLFSVNHETIRYKVNIFGVT